MASTFRCNGCKGYFPIADVYAANGVSRFCSSECVASKRPSNGRSEIGRSSTRSRSGPSHTRKPMTRTRNPGSDIPPATRVAVFLRDAGRCRMCGRNSPIVHHIHYRSEGVDHSLHNLILLCNEPCHLSIVHADKRHWQPICLAYVWLRMVEGKMRTLREIETSLARTVDSFDPDGLPS